RSLTRSMKERATRTFTSASSNATRISRETSSMSRSVMRPRLRSREKMPSSRSLRASNTEVSGYRPGRGLRVDLEERRRELDRGEFDQVADALADADDLHRDPELGLDREDNATLRGAIELREHDAGDIDRLGELLGLHEPVLSRRRVDDEQHFFARTFR